MRKRSLTMVVAIVIVMLVATGCGNGAPKVDWNLEITGAVETPLTLSYQDLTERDQVVLENVLMRKSQGENETNTWEGPDLMAILEEAGMSENAVSLLLTASDGYAKEVNISDLDQAIIALKRDGVYTTDDTKTAPIRVVIPNLPADGWLYKLTSIEVVE